MYRYIQVLVIFEALHLYFSEDHLIKTQKLKCSWELKQFDE